MRDLFAVEIAAPYAGHNEVSFNFGTVLSRVPGLSRRKGADLKVPNTYAAHVCLYKYSASRKNKRHLLDRHAGFDTVNSGIQCLVIKGYLKLQKARSIVSIKLPQLDSRRIFLIPRSF